MSGSEVAQVILEWNDCDATFDPSIGGIEVVDVLLAIVVI